MGKKRKGRANSRKNGTVRMGRMWPTIRRYAQSEAQPLLKKIKSLTKKNEQPYRIALTNYLIVRSVTMLEHFLVNELKKFVDAHEDQIDINDFITNPKDFKKESKSKILISTFSYSNPKDIQFIFSGLLKINFFDEIKQESKEYAPYFSLELEHIPYTKPIHKNWEEVLQTFMIRHNIVHNNKLVNLPYHKIRNLVGGMMQLIHCSYITIRHRRRV